MSISYLGRFFHYFYARHRSPVSYTHLASNGLLCDEERYALLSQSPAVVLSLGARNNPDVQAHRLFAALRQFDRTDVRHIWAPVPQKKGVGLAVYNRLMKAAGFCVADAQTLLQNTSKSEG